LSRALESTGFDRADAAARLGLTVRQMRYRMARLNMDTLNPRFLS